MEPSDQELSTTEVEMTTTEMETTDQEVNTDEVEMTTPGMKTTGQELPPLRWKWALPRCTRPIRR